VKLNHHRRWSAVVGILLFGLLLSACGSANNGSTTSSGSGSSSGSTTKAAPGQGCKKVGVLLPETASSARWDSKDRPALQADIAAAIPGAQVLYNNASGDANLQQTQAEADLSNGACILVVAPSDSQKAAAIVASAKAKNVPVIAYDRLIYSNDLNYYVSFDNQAVGNLQGKYIADHYKEYVTGANNKLL
jgi:D-xylose transport system substrate-binding protein